MAFTGIRLFHHVIFGGWGMNRTIAPMGAKVLALISVILTVLALIACLGLIFLQDVLKGAFSSASEIRDIFVFR